MKNNWNLNKTMKRGIKMKNKLFALLCSLMMALGFSSTALAADQSALVGFVNVQYVLQNYPGIMLGGQLKK